jgi:AAA domain-containing protein/CHC2-type zinc finger protein
MSGEIEDAKRRLPLPQLMRRLGLGDHAQKSAKCPFHEDKHNSFSVWQRPDGKWFWKCHAACGEGDEITFLERHRNISNSDATKLFLEIGVSGARPNEAKPHHALDWQACVDAFGARHLELLAKWRGYSVEFCSWLKQNGLVGLYNGCIALPVHDRTGKVVAVHYRLKDGSWRYYPQGATVRLLVIGELLPGDHIHPFESQWDAFAFMDVSGERTGVLITRGASNGALVAGLIPQGSTVYLWTQNDSAGKRWQQDICAKAKCVIKRARIPAQHKDLNDWTMAGATERDLLAAIVDAEIIHEAPRPLIEFKTPSQLKNFVAPPGMVLVGDCHIVRGLVFVIGGAPGVGKSFAAVDLAVAGATAREWFGLTVHRQFKTMIIQNENGPFRLSKDFGQLNCDALENYIRVCPPPPFGMCFSRDDFRAQLAAAIREFEPDVIILDPWNAAARDEKAQEYLETFDLIRSVLPAGDDAPALGIVAHRRKPRADERATGRGLLNLLAGSYVLGSVPRCVFVMQAASDDPQDNQIVWTCCKNNDGELGDRSAWERRNGLFAPVSDFDWETFDNPRDERVTITANHLAMIFENGQKQLTKAEAVKALQMSTEAGRTACYNALKLDGRFAAHLIENQSLLSWKP